MVERVMIVVVGTLLLLLPVLGALWLLNRFAWFTKMKGDRPWYKDIWKPIAFLAALSLIQAVLRYL